MSEYKVETQCVHGRGDSSLKDQVGAITFPIYQTATFEHPGIGESTGYDYSRVSNPTRTLLEETVSALEHATTTLAFATGMAAIGACMELFETGAHILYTADLYGGSARIFRNIYQRRGMQFESVNTEDPELVEQHIRENTRAIYVETPSNPMMYVTDLKKISELAKKHGLLLLVDNTFLTPYFQTPIDFGADIVIHSGTKYIGGHNDTLSGFVCTADEELGGRLKQIYKTTGGCLSPFDAFLVHRGLKTLPIRMERIQENAMKIAEWMKNQEKITQVYYVGLPEHPKYEISKRQTSGFGGMISFRVNSAQTAAQVLERIKLITFAESLGGVETLLTYPMLQTHADVPEEERKRLGITDTLLRLSVGIENVDDLIADLEQALA